MPGTIDLRNTSLKLLGGDCWWRGGLVILPESIEKIQIHTDVNIELESTKNLKLFNITWGRCTIKVDRNDSLSGQYDFNVLGRDLWDLGQYTNLLTDGVKNFSFTTTSYIELSIGHNTVDSKFLSNLTSCSSMTFDWVTFTNLDGNDFPDSLTDLTISNCKLTNFKNLSALSNLKSLSLKGNLFSELPDFYELSGDSSLTTLNLSDNSLQNYTSVSLNGETSSYKTCDILSRFKNLTSIDLSGNKDLTDFSPLTTTKNDFKAYTDNGKHIFTRALN